ncbi:MAG: hypothetical protein ACQETL_02170 [Bacteroidota bacterium]
MRPFSKDSLTKGEIFETQQPPPNPPLGGKTINKRKCFNIEKELVNYWNKIAEQETVLYTNQCSSFYVKSNYAEYFFNK